MAADHTLNVTLVQGFIEADPPLAPLPVSTLEVYLPVFQFDVSISSIYVGTDPGFYTSVCPPCPPCEGSPRPGSGIIYPRKLC